MSTNEGGAASTEAPVTKIIIELEIEGNTDHAYDVVDRILDQGVLQDAIHEYCGHDRPLKVTSAYLQVTSTLVEDRKP